VVLDLKAWLISVSVRCSGFTVSLVRITGFARITYSTSTLIYGSSVPLPCILYTSKFRYALVYYYQMFGIDFIVPDPLHQYYHIIQEPIQRTPLFMSERVSIH
jgi:hypothetical protein